MKPKITRNRKSGEVVVSYFHVNDVYHFRLALLGRIIDGADTDITVMVNTNQCKTRLEFEEIECALDKAGIAYDSWPVDENAKRLFGIRTDILRKGKAKKQKLYVATISPDKFTEDIFRHLFQYYDILLGFSRLMDYAKILEALKVESYDEVMFNKKYFENSVYDSVVCESIKSTIDIAPYVKALR